MPQNFETSFEGFDEVEYLAANPDIAEAVSRGSFKSGWDHFMQHGMKEQRPGLKENSNIVEALTKKIISVPIPPPALRVRVHGGEELETFHKVGKILALDIESVITGRAIKLNNLSNILDFGCGCGRALTWFQNFYPYSNFYGCDIDEEAINWCQENLADKAEFLTNNSLPPLPYTDNHFDLIYSISIFTHLPEDMQFKWLEELSRITKSGSYLFLTTLSFDSFPEELIVDKPKHLEKGFYYLTGEGTAGLPDFYQICFHTEAYIEKNWSKYFEIEKIIPKSIARHQDLIVCKVR